MGMKLVAVSAEEYERVMRHELALAGCTLATVDRVIGPLKEVVSALGKALDLTARGVPALSVGVGLADKFFDVLAFLRDCGEDDPQAQGDLRILGEYLKPRLEELLPRREVPPAPRLAPGPTRGRRR